LLFGIRRLTTPIRGAGRGDFDARQVKRVTAKLRYGGERRTTLKAAQAPVCLSVFIVSFVVEGRFEGRPLWGGLHFF
jgi:hypothetical protein